MAVCLLQLNNLLRHHHTNTCSSAATPACDWSFCCSSSQIEQGAKRYILLVMFARENLLEVGVDPKLDAKQNRSRLCEIAEEINAIINRCCKWILVDSPAVFQPLSPGDSLVRQDDFASENGSKAQLDVCPNRIGAVLSSTIYLTHQQSISLRINNTCWKALPQLAAPKTENL